MTYQAQSTHDKLCPQYFSPINRCDCDVIEAAYWRGYNDAKEGK